MSPLVVLNQRPSRYSRGPEALDALDILLKEQMQRDPRLHLEYSAHELLHEISGHVRTLRKDAGLTQQELADKINVPQPFVAQLENPHSATHPSLTTLAKVAVALGRRLVVRFEDTSGSSSLDSGAGVRSSDVALADIPGHLRKESYVGESAIDRVDYALAAAEEGDADSDVDPNALGSLIIEGVSYNVYEDDQGHVRLHGVIPPDVTHLRLGDALYELQPMQVEGATNPCTVLIGLIDMGRFLAKHNMNPQDPPVTFERSK
jgi:transcriptional regulator with XRE-family HTH domain